jgi:DnaJ-class molecular chaperone
VLSDPKQKIIYDKYGKEGLRNGGGGFEGNRGGGFGERMYNPQYQGGR